VVEFPFRPLRTKINAINAIKAIPRTPPTTPPTIAPVFETELDLLFEEALVEGPPGSVYVVEVAVADVGVGFGTAEDSGPENSVN
jgi:hypothetical protein